MAFALLAIGSMLGYALQNVLLVRYARSIDALSLSFYRNATFVVTLSPLLLGATGADAASLLGRWPLLVVSALAGAIAQSLSFSAFRRLNVGVASAFNAGCASVVTVAMSRTFLGETVDGTTAAFIGLVCAGCLLLGVQRMSHPELQPRTATGFLLCLCASVFFVTTRIVLASASRSANPWLSSYVWETSFAGASAGMLLLRRAAGRPGLQRIAPRDLARIALFALPTLAGTTLYAFAARLGPLPVLSAFSTLSLAASAILARILYREKLTSGQWLAMGVILAGVLGTKLA